MKRGEKKNIDYSTSPPFSRDINLNFTLYFTLREKEEDDQELVDFLQTIKFNFEFRSTVSHSSCTRNFITPSYNKTTNKYARSTTCRPVARSNEASASGDDGWNIESYESISSSS